MIDFRAIEITVHKATINKNDRDKIAWWEIAIPENTLLKLFVVDIVSEVSQIIIFLLKEIVSHELEFFTSDSLENILLQPFVLK